MKRFLIPFLCAFATLLCGCSAEEDVLPDQRTRIVNYLRSTHLPRLVDETEREEEGQVPFYSTAGSTVYRFIASYYNPDRPRRREVTARSRVRITFRAYVFSYANISDSTMPFFSNDPLLEQAFYEAGLTPGVWSFEPIEIDMAGSDILKGLRAALLGCREGDEVEAYMTYNMAFGDGLFGTIPLESPVAYFFTVDTVED